jgi:rod shape-determining protein MreC
VRGPAPFGTRLRPARRSSFARRESNLRLIAALLTGGVIAFAIFMLLVQRVDPEQAGRIQGAGADILAPIHALVSAPVRWTGQAAGRVGDHFRAVERLREAEAELEAARLRAAEADTLAAEIARLEGLLRMQRPERRVVATTRVSSAPAHAASQTAIIGAGRSQGVRPQMPVIAPDGLAGRVTDVGISAARILLLTDGTSRVPVRVQRTGWTGLAVGNGSRLLEFQTDMSGIERILPGDRLVTSGDGGIFPPGIPVAVILDAEASPPLARPLANPASLGVVSVEAAWLPPPSFVPTPTAAPEPDRAPAPPANGAVGEQPAQPAAAPREPAAAPREPAAGPREPAAGPRGPAIPTPAPRPGSEPAASAARETVDLAPPATGEPAP